MIKLGQKVRDVVTGFEGIADCRSEWLNGCVRFSVQPPMRRDKDDLTNGGFVPDAKMFDEAQLEILQETPIVLPQQPAEVAPSGAKVNRTGGGRPDPPRRRDPR